MPRSGRPKTGAGHRDDAMLDMIDFRAKLNDQIALEQQHYRARRDGLTALIELVDSATVSWRYGELVDGMLSQTGPS